jgi:hypothetical protein
MVAVDTVRVAGKTMDKRVVYFGGAAALGVVGYAYWRNARDNAAPQMLTADPNLAPVDVPTDEPGFSVFGPNKPPQSNVEWRDTAVAKLISIGLDGGAVSSAIGKYLAKQPLTKTEIDLVNQAIAAAGYPPEGGPFTIVEIPSGGVVTPPPEQNPPPAGNPPAATPGPPSAPTSVRATGFKDAVLVEWSASSGADGYELARFTATAQDTPWLYVGNTTAWLGRQDVNVDTQYAYYIRARGAGGYSAPTGSNPVWITAN